MATERATDLQKRIHVVQAKLNDILIKEGKLDYLMLVYYDQNGNRYPNLMEGFFDYKSGDNIAFGHAMFDTNGEAIPWARGCYIHQETNRAWMLEPWINRHLYV